MWYSVWCYSVCAEQDLNSLIRQMSFMFMESSMIPFFDFIYPCYFVNENYLSWRLKLWDWFLYENFLLERISVYLFLIRFVKRNNIKEILLLSLYYIFSSHREYIDQSTLSSIKSHYSNKFKEHGQTDHSWHSTRIFLWNTSFSFHWSILLFISLE